MTESPPTPHDNAPVPGPTPVTVDEVKERFFRLLGEENGPLLYIWLCVAAVGLVVSLATVFVEDALGASVFSAVVTLPIGSISSIAFFATMAALYATDERDGELTFDEAIDVSIAHIVPVIIAGGIFHIVTSLGSFCFVVPGVALALAFYPAPFLSATHGVGIAKGVEKSIEWVKRHYLVGLITVAIGIGIGFFVAVIGVVGFIFFDVGSLLMTNSGLLLFGVAIWGAGAFVGYFGWLWTGAMLVSIARREGVPAPAVPDGTSDEGPSSPDVGTW